MAKKRSATMPTKNGDTIAASAVVPYAAPLSVPEKLSVFSRYVPIVTYHAPQMKNSRNIITESLSRMVCVIGSRSQAHSRAGLQPRRRHSTFILMFRKATSASCSCRTMWPDFARP